MRLLTFPALLATRTLLDKMSWLQAVNAMPGLLENGHLLPVWQRPELYAGVQRMLTQFASHTEIVDVDMIRQLCGRLLWTSRLTSSVGITY